MTKLKTNLAYTAALCFIAIGVYQQKEKTVQLPPLTLQQYNIVMQAIETCDCPSKSTPQLYQSFLSTGRTQAPEWFGLKADSSSKHGKP